MKLKRNILIGSIAIFIIILLWFYLSTSSVGTLFPKLDKLKKENELLHTQLDVQKKMTDSLLLSSDSLTIEWDNVEPLTQTTIEIKYHEKINNIITLDDDSTVLLLSDWLSEIDSLQR